MPSDKLLEYPGEVDLSAYVNFIALAQACGESERLADPMLLTQQDFLTAMGISHRCSVVFDDVSNSRPPNLRRAIVWIPSLRD